MGWSSIERRLERFRDRLAADPTGVRQEVQEFLSSERRLRPADRMRLLGLVVAAGRKLGEFDAAEQAALEAFRIGSVSAVANADFLLQFGTLRMMQHRSVEALEVVDRARQLMAKELAKPAPSTKVSRSRRRWIRSTKAAAFVVRGQIFLLLLEGSIEQAFADTFEALRLTSNLVRASSHTYRVHLSAVTLLSSLLLRFGSGENIPRALQVIDHAERILIYRCRTPPDHVHRIKLKWGRAVALARMGRLERAEQLLVDVVERLFARGLKDDGKVALDALVWVIKQTRRPDRAGYFVLKYKRQGLCG